MSTTAKAWAAWIVVLLLLCTAEDALAANGFLSENSRQEKNLGQAEIHREIATVNAESQRVCDDSCFEHAADCVVAPKNTFLSSESGLGTTKFPRGEELAPRFIFENAAAEGIQVRRGLLTEIRLRLRGAYARSREIGVVEVRYGTRKIELLEEIAHALQANNPKDVRYGEGQYVSDIAPGTRTPSELSYDFLRIPFQGRRFTHYVEIDVTGLEVIQGREGVFVIPGNKPLDLTGRIVGSGKVPTKP